MYPWASHSCSKEWCNWRNNLKPVVATDSWEVHGYKSTGAVLDILEGFQNLTVFIISELHSIPLNKFQLNVRTSIHRNLKPCQSCAMELTSLSSSFSYVIKGTTWTDIGKRENVFIPINPTDLPYNSKGFNSQWSSALP